MFTGELAIPGGMIDKNESASQAVVREFVEEALGGRENDKLDSFWQQGKVIYTGYVDDPRNTDNAWIETTCVNFHDTSGILDSVKLEVFLLYAILNQFSIHSRPATTPKRRSGRRWART